MTYFGQSINNHIYGIKKLDGCKLVMKSMGTKNHGLFGIGSCYKSPYRQCHGFWDLEHACVTIEHEVLKILLHLRPPSISRNKF